MGLGAAKTYNNTIHINKFVIEIRYSHLLYPIGNNIFLLGYSLFLIGYSLLPVGYSLFPVG